MRFLPLFAAIVLSSGAMAQDLLHQPTNAAEPGPMPQNLLDLLDDPVFNIVIKAEPQPRTLEDLVASLLEGGRSDFQSFVVGEQIGRPETVTECGPAMRRMVLAFTGTHAPTSTILAGNVFLSTFLTPAGPAGDVEVLAWDQTQGSYAYYKLEDGTWRFRNRSSDLQSAAAGELAEGCLACHVNGAPIMKEFAFPWNNWDGLPNTFKADYLRPGAESWPAADSDLLGRRFTGAQELEAVVQSSIQRFADALIAERTAVAPDGPVTITDLPGLLDSLFRPTELNLGSSNIKSGLDGGGLTQSPPGAMNIPDSFFLNVGQMRDIDLPVLQGLPLVTELFTPGNLGLSVAEYRQLLAESGTDTACMPGRDTLFAWFGPEPSEFDRRMVERLNKRGIVDEDFVAAVLAIDVETPLFSDARASLLGHVPASISASNAAGLAEALRNAVVASLRADADRSESEADFLALLQGGGAVDELDRRVRDYLERSQAALDDPAERGPHLQALFAKLARNRQSFVQADISRNLNEAPGLLPE